MGKKVGHRRSPTAVLASLGRATTNGASGAHIFTKASAPVQPFQDSGATLSQLKIGIARVIAARRYRNL
jgi:hypothetical protein